MICLFVCVSVCACVAVFPFVISQLNLLGEKNKKNRAEWKQRSGDILKSVKDLEQKVSVCVREPEGGVGGR